MDIHDGTEIQTHGFTTQSFGFKGRLLNHIVGLLPKQIIASGTTTGTVPPECFPVVPVPRKSRRVSFASDGRRCRFYRPSPLLGRNLDSPDQPLPSRTLSRDASVHMEAMGLWRSSLDPVDPTWPSPRPDIDIYYQSKFTTFLPFRQILLLSIHSKSVLSIVAWNFPQDVANVIFEVGKGQVWFIFTYYSVALKFYPNVLHHVVFQG